MDNDKINEQRAKEILDRLDQDEFVFTMNDLEGEEYVTLPNGKKILCDIMNNEIKEKFKDYQFVKETKNGYHNAINIKNLPKNNISNEQSQKLNNNNSSSSSQHTLKDQLINFNDYIKTYEEDSNTDIFQNSTIALSDSQTEKDDIFENTETEKYYVSDENNEDISHQSSNTEINNNNSKNKKLQLENHNHHHLLLHEKNENIDIIRTSDDDDDDDNNNNNNILKTPIMTSSKPISIHSSSESYKMRQNKLSVSPQYYAYPSSFSSSLSKSPNVPSTPPPSLAKNSVINLDQIFRSKEDILNIDTKNKEMSAAAGVSDDLNEEKMEKIMEELLKKLSIQQQQE